MLWSDYLKAWSQEVLELDEEYLETLPREVITSRWLGYLGAQEQQLEMTEKRLGVALPPSYRSFLRASNGFRRVSYDIYRLLSTDEIEWFAVRNQEWIDAWNSGYADGQGEVPIIPDEAYFVYGPKQNHTAVRAKYLQTTLQISDPGEPARQSIMLLNPRVQTIDGEWEAWHFSDDYPGAARYRSFWDMMHECRHVFRNWVATMKGR